MGLFLNRGNQEFKGVLNSEIYIDKSGMIDVFNSLIGTEQRYACISRPRRFGKSIAANMLAAYYEKGCDSRALFEDKKIAQTANWDRYLNKYDVIRIDMADIIAEQNDSAAALDYIDKWLLKDLDEAFPDMINVDEDEVATALDKINTKTGAQFVIIIDEWDCLFRDEKSNFEIQKRYINFLRALFKGNRSKKFTALAYITGILPIKKNNSESALNNFYEYTMTDPAKLSEYIGFTADEVLGLCQKYNMDYNEVCAWYDGYSFPKTGHIFGPNSVVCAMLSESCKNYWSQTVAFNSLSTYISMNYDGLRDVIVDLIAGVKRKVNVFGYENDMTSFKNKDDVLTMLIHLGYLKYNDENSLAVSIGLAFYSARKEYNVVREMPAGEGFADMVFLPKYNVVKPPMIIELKWDRDAETAISQIKEKKYPESLGEYKGEVILIGISYEKDGPDAKKHHCTIERIEME